MLVTIGRYLDVSEAHILRARLEAEGIAASVADAQHMRMNWPISTALGGARLQVPDTCLEQARAVLEAYESGELENELMAGYAANAECCPACGSESIRRSVSFSRRVLVILTTIIAYAPFPARSTRMRCQDCGHRWRTTRN